MLDDDVDYRIGNIGFLAGQHLIEDTAKAVDIGPAVRFAAPGLFRTDVVWTAQKYAGGGKVTLCVHVLGDAEVRQDWCIVLEQNVRRFDVTVNDTAFMCLA